MKPEPCPQFRRARFRDPGGTETVLPLALEIAADHLALTRESGLLAGKAPLIDRVRLGGQGPVAIAQRALSRAARSGTHADCEVILADGVTPHQLLAQLLNHDVNLRLFEVVVPTLHQIFVNKVGAAAAVAERRDDEEVDRA